MSANPDFIPMPYPEWLTGCFYDGPQATDADRERVARKICIACGAKQAPDGTLPCGHDHDL
ncbi:hypothetical protein [Caballeronia sp. LZ035]|uniref:hypothetical protein n=1 Tax=Caballeronia sp. LZ035 TaxID=3038568 RepID=UPI002854B8C7|nr:hypothetical protein [Caballeronia sp. LZ035]MDR5761932.1 hypothetical protein [Caballeronia sp. LZ035]